MDHHISQTVAPKLALILGKVNTRFLRAESSDSEPEGEDEEADEAEERPRRQKRKRAGSTDEEAEEAAEDSGAAVSIAQLFLLSLLLLNFGKPGFSPCLTRLKKF